MFVLKAGGRVLARTTAAPGGWRPAQERGSPVRAEPTPLLLGQKKAILVPNSFAFEQSPQGSSPAAKPQPAFEAKPADRVSAFTKFSLSFVLILTTNWLISCNVTAVPLIWHIWLRLDALKIWNWKVLVPTATTGSNYPSSANFQNRRNSCFLQPSSKGTAKEMSLCIKMNLFLLFCDCISIRTSEISSVSTFLDSFLYLRQNIEPPKTHHA